MMNGTWKIASIQAAPEVTMLRSIIRRGASAGMMWSNSAMLEKKVFGFEKT